MPRNIYVKIIKKKKDNEIAFEVKADTKDPLTAQEIIDAISEMILISTGDYFLAEDERLDS